MSLTFKRRSSAACICISALTVFLSSCNKDSNPTSFTDDYKPSLTESSGTTHQGNYFPLKAGNTFTYSGTMTTIMSGNMSFSGDGESGSESMDTTMTMPVDENITVGTQTQITYAGNPVSVFPVTTISSTPSMLYMDTETTSSITYYEDTDDGIYQRAVNSTGTIIESPDVLFIRKPLVVGDSWESNPEYSFSDLGDLDDISGDGSSTPPIITSKAVTYVAGQETITVNGTATPVIRLDQRAEVSITFKDQEIGDISLTTKGTINIYLQENVGMVKETVDMTMNMNMKMNDEEMSMTVNMTADMNGDITLSSMELNKQRVIESDDLSPEQKFLLKTAFKTLRTLL